MGRRLLSKLVHPTLLLTKLPWPDSSVFLGDVSHFLSPMETHSSLLLNL